MSNIKFFLHDDEKITGITTKRAHYAFYEYLIDSNGNIIKTFVDGKEYRAMFIDIPDKKKPSFEDECEVNVTTATPTEFPFTEYGKTVTLSPCDKETQELMRQRKELLISAEKHANISLWLSSIAIGFSVVSIILVIARHYV